MDEHDAPTPPSPSPYDARPERRLRLPTPARCSPLPLPRRLPLLRPSRGVPARASSRPAPRSPWWWPPAVPASRSATTVAARTPPEARPAVASASGSAQASARVARLPSVVRRSPGRVEQGGAPFDSSSGTPASDDQLTGLVRIATTLKYQGGKAAGTGMILTSTGEVVTNHHVVEGATTIRVTVMSTGQNYRATVVGTDAKDDVAVLQLNNANGLSVVQPATTAAEVGDAVTAVGDAGGSASTFSTASGTVTALDQSITTRNQDGSASEKLSGLIEISNDVIPGDSGGATYDDEGDVVGMTTAASSGDSDVVGYAVPIAKVVSIADDLENGTVNARYEYGNPAFLGVGLAGTGTDGGRRLRRHARRPGRHRRRRPDHPRRRHQRQHRGRPPAGDPGLLPRRQRPARLDRLRRHLPHRHRHADRRAGGLTPQMGV